MSLPESTESSVKLQQYWLLLKRHYLPVSIVFGVVVALTGISLALQKPIYEAEGKLLFRKNSPSSSYLPEVGKGIGELQPLQEQNNPVDTEAEIIRSLPIIKKTITRLELKDESGKTLKLEQFLKKLDVTDVKKTDVLQIAYRDADPNKAATVVNTLMAVYLESNLLANRSEAMSAREFVQNQLPMAEKSLRQSESELRQFQEQNKVVDLTEEKKAAVEIIADMQRQAANANAGLADAKAQSELLKQQLGETLNSAGTVTSISQFPAVQGILKEIQQIESQLAVEQSRFQADFPNVVSRKQKKASLEQLLKQRLKQVVGEQKSSAGDSLQNSEFDQKLTEEFVRAEARRLGLSSQIAAISNVQSSYRERLDRLPQLEQLQRALERKIQTAQSTYLLLQQKLQEIRIAENQNIGNARVISAATPPEEAVAPRKILYLVTGIMLGGILAAATALILEKLDKSLRSVEEARKIFGYTLLGIIPALKKSENIFLRDRSLERATPEILVQESPRSPFSQAYRMLQANLKFLNSDKQLKAIVVTSSVPKEGKSTVAANLAVTIAQMGRKVLLVDADMYRPLQHEIWELPNHLGLSNIIVGQTEPKTAIKKITANLHILTSGVIPPNPMALLDSPRMASLISVFSANYDYTIIDAPALNAAADAAILGKMTDGVLLVVRPGVVDTAAAIRAKEFLEKSGQHVLGQVVNGYNSDSEQYYYYRSSQSEEDDNVALAESHSPLSISKKR
ncbi:lipopolysaccharide biosynthesis protein [cyanobacterium TDX16]|nr:lipopolysaccharide biosynthesis protein [cyanobacterium TDX16]